MVFKCQLFWVWKPFENNTCYFFNRNIQLEYLHPVSCLCDLYYIVIPNISILILIFFSSTLHVVLRKIFGAMRVEITGELRKLYNSELHAFYSSSNIIRNLKSRRLRWAGHIARMELSRNAYKILVGRPEG